MTERRLQDLYDSVETEFSQIKLSDLCDHKKREMSSSVWSRISRFLIPIRAIERETVYHVNKPPYLFGAFSRKFLYRNEETGEKYTAEYFHATFDSIPNVIVKKVKKRKA